MSEPISVDSLPPAVKRVLARREHHAEIEHEDAALDQRWPISVDVRSVVVNLALEMSGLVVDPEGTVSPMEPTDKNPRPKPRTRLAAMRILATCDKLALEQRKIELAQDPSSIDDDGTLTPGQILNSMPMSKEIAGEILIMLGNLPLPSEAPEVYAGVGREPVVIPQLSRDRWPITRAMRCAVVESALELCGYSISGPGRVAPIPVTDETPKPKQRIVLGAMRILTRFDRLSIMEQRVRHRYERLRSKRRNQMRKGDAPGVTWEFLAKVCEMVEEDARQRARAG